MKLSILLCFLLFLSAETFSQSGYYTWINHSLNQLLSERGKPVKTQDYEGLKHYIYYYNGNSKEQTDFVVENNRIITVVTSTFWPNEAKAIKAAKFVVDLYINDGFTVTQTSKGHYKAYNERYIIDIEVAHFHNESFSVNETAFPNS